jgi:two-component system, OmpR family, sensor histidine kinase MprB
MSLRTRIASIVALTVTVLLIGVGAAVQVVTASTLVAAVDDDLRAIATSIRRDPRGLVVLAPGRDRFGGAAGLVQIVDDQGVVPIPRRGMAGPAADVVRLPVDDEVLAVARGDAPVSIRTLDVEGVRLRMLVSPIGDRFAVQVARPLDEVEAVIGALRRRTVLLTAAGALLAALAAWFVAGRSIRPVVALTSAVERVRDGADLARRVSPVISGDDEVARLARAFDAMLERLEASRVAQDRLAADASHELRTPLTSLRTNVEVLAADAERLAPEARRQLTEDVIGQLEELTVMVDGLVSLTRVDTGSSERTEVDVALLAADVVGTARRRFPQRADDLMLDVVDVTGDGAGAVAGAGGRHAYGDARELTLAVSAMVDNAVKYAPSGPIVVRVEGSRGDGVVRITVRDHGPGVDEALLPNLFARFYRTPDARSRPGAGLGLALVDRVARAHGGEASVVLVAPHGLAVTLMLPVHEQPVHDRERRDT